MKKIILCVIMISLINGVTIAKAHPGNTDSYGGHTCESNCVEWGLYYGEYHVHDQQDLGRDSVYVSPSPNIKEPPKPVKTDKGGAEAGKEQAESDYKRKFFNEVGYDEEGRESEYFTKRYTTDFKKAYFSRYKELKKNEAKQPVQYNKAKEKESYPKIAMPE